MHVSIDFETKNAKTDIRKVGGSRYAQDAEILCLSYSINGGPISTWLPGQLPPYDLIDAIENGATVHAHNAAFERAIWKNVCVGQYGWPPVAKWRCTMARALYSGLPASLDNVSKAVGVTAKKDLAGRRVMMQMTKPRKPRKNEPQDAVLWYDTPEHYAKLIPYCEQDVRTEMEVASVVMDLTPREWSVYDHDTLVNERGVRIDTQLVHACIKVWNKYTKRLNRELAEATFGALTSASQASKMVDLLSHMGIELEDVKKGTVERVLLDSGLGPVATRMLEIRQELAKSSVSKYKKMVGAVESDGRIRGCFQYHGAQRTGRFSGRLVQFQNLPRGIIDETNIDAVIAAILALDLDAVMSFGPIGDVLASMIRCSIIPADGKRLLVCDFSSVEARALAWLAGEKWLLDAFEKNEDPYIHMASSVYGVPYAEVNKSQRFFGKTLVLGAGYGLGAGGLQRQLRNQKIVMSLGECQGLIDAYRAKNPRIKKLWYQVEDAAIQCVRSGRHVRCGKIVFHRRGDWLCVRLPSSRDLHYYKPSLVPGRFGKEQVEFLGTKEGKVIRETTYGGRAVENVCQAVCRDLLVEAMARLERAGYEVPLHVHDEVACEVPIGFGSIEEMRAIMVQVPTWAEGFPVGAEGFECTRYRK